MQVVHNRGKNVYLRSGGGKEKGIYEKSLYFTLNFSVNIKLLRKKSTCKYWKIKNFNNQFFQLKIILTVYYWHRPKWQYLGL